MKPINQPTLYRRVLSAVAALALLPTGLQAQTPTPTPSQPDYNPYNRPQPKDSEQQIQTGMQITELGLMRALLVLDSSSLDSETLIAQRLNEAGFRVFPSAQQVATRLTVEDIRRIGVEAKADLVVYALSKTRPKKAMGEFQLFEGEATVQIYSPATGELMVTNTARSDGTRTTDEVAAEHSAREKSLDLCAKEAIVRSLEKAHKIMVYQAILTRVRSNRDLLFFMEQIAKMQGIYHVRRISWNEGTGDAEIEIIASPKTESFWRTQIENIPKRPIKITSYTPGPQAPAGIDGVPAWMKK